MNTSRIGWTPSTGIAFGRISGLLLLGTMWLHGPSGQAGVVLLLFLSVLSIARWRFRLPAWTALLDQAACIAASAWWPDAWMGLALPTFEALLAGRGLLIVPSAIAVLVYGQLSLPLVAACLLAALFGGALRAWSAQVTQFRQEADLERRGKYELERLRSDWLAAGIQASRMAELAERDRIARELHDHVGHDLTASAMALQAYAQLMKEGDPGADELLEQARHRLTRSLSRLRDTVHAIAPDTDNGVGRLERIVRDFGTCPVGWHVHGDTGKVQPYLWSILEPCLKEALTNVERHARAAEVVATLDVGEQIVRLSVRNDGAGPADDAPGIGLRSLRQRARAVGGSVSASRDDAGGYAFVCVLPLHLG